MYLYICIWIYIYTYVDIHTHTYIYIHMLPRGYSTAKSSVKRARLSPFAPAAWRSFQNSRVPFLKVVLGGCSII